MHVILVSRLSYGVLYGHRSILGWVASESVFTKEVYEDAVARPRNRTGYPVIRATLIRVGVNFRCVKRLPLLDSLGAVLSTLSPIGLFLESARLTSEIWR